jgi:pimeloyl-ACP methyl ester carboxylesterase
METELILLDILEDVVAELEARLPGYLQRQPLQLLADDALANRCLALASAVGVPLSPVRDEAACNAVDRYLRLRLTRALSKAGAAPASSAAGAPASRARERWRQLTDARDEQRAGVRALAEELRERAVPGVPGLRYYAVGAGEVPLVALNALGQTVTAWLPLLERLARRHRVLLCPMRTCADDGRTVTFAEHCDDVRAVLAEEGVDSCHLLGWCTGAKLAVRYARSHPADVRSLIFLAGSFKHPGRAAELDTRYERNLEAMLRAVAQQPALADRLRGVLAQAAGGSPELQRLDAGALAQRALTGVPCALERDARHPFRDSAALLTYANQHLEFWSHDELGAQPPLRVPALGLIGEHDPIVGAAALRLALEAFAVSGFELIHGATHYSFYERPRHLAGAIEQWIETWSDPALRRREAGSPATHTSAVSLSVAG